VTPEVPSNPLMLGFCDEERPQAPTNTQSPPLPGVPVRPSERRRLLLQESGESPIPGRQRPPQPPSALAPYLRWGARANCRTPGISPSTWRGALCPAWGCRREGPDVCVGGEEGKGMRKRRATVPRRVASPRWPCKGISSLSSGLWFVLRTTSYKVQPSFLQLTQGSLTLPLMGLVSPEDPWEGEKRSYLLGGEPG